MKTLLALVAACGILTACDFSDPVRSTGQTTTPPTRPPGVIPTTPFIFWGTVRDQNGVPVAGARVEILGGSMAYWGLSATTNQTGTFTIEGVRGELWVQVGKVGYHSSVRTYSVSSDTRIDVVLVSGMLPSAPISDTLQLGKTIRGITNEPPCDPTRWDALAPCRRFDFVSETPGQLNVTISTVGLMMDATFVTRFSDQYLGTSEEAGPGEMTLSIDVAAFTQYEIRVNSYYEQQEFNLRAEFLPLSP
jgi:hypothetical protein